MNKSLIETILGAVVLTVAGFFMLMAYNSSSLGGHSNGYILKASFDKVDGVSIGTDIKVSGIKIGTVTDMKLDTATFLATLTLSIDGAIKLPKDTVVSIASEGLLGGNYVSMIVGGDEETLKAGDSFTFTQSPISITDMLGKFVFSAAESKTGATPSNAASTTAPTPAQTN
jgi:phospholipid/cholesterol/gamma-HCH transport system substrate-binding protein